MNLKSSLSVLLLLVLFGFQADLGAQYYFGRNKIQYDDFEWKVLTTEHFDVYFYPEMRELAEIGAAFAEEAYDRLSAKTNHNITKRVPLIFYSNHSHFQQTNTTPGFLPEGVGGFFEFIKGRVVIPSNGSIHDFKHVINHELVHVFTRNKMNRVLKDHRRTTHAGMPLWFTEGIAEYWSEGWDSQAEMILRDAVLSGHLVPLQRMYYIFGTFLMYKEGQAICKYIAETFGEEKLLQLIENVWKEDHFSAVMKLTIGLDYEEFDEKWTYDLKKQYYPSLGEGDLPRMASHVITKKGINTKPSCFRYKNRDYVVFVSNRVGYSNIYIKPLEGHGDDFEDPEVLIKGERTSDFESFHLLRSKIDANDDGLLTFVSKSGATDAIYVYDVEEREVRNKFQFEDLVSLSSPNWSPDNLRIAFSGISYAGLNDIYILDIESGAVEKITNDFYSDRDPAWSPDGNALAFSSDRGHYGREGYMNLYVYYLDNNAVINVTQGKHNDYAPAWSPDGSYLAFTSDRDGAFNIWMIKNRLPTMPPISGVVMASLEEGAQMKSSSPVNEGYQVPVTSYPSALEKSDELKKLTNFTTGAFDPAWVDDEKLLFTAFEKFTFQLRQVDDVQERFDQAVVVSHDTLATGLEGWSASKLAGDIASTTIKYEKKFDIDIAQSAVSHDPVFGTFGGAQLAMSDMLGNQQYYFLVYNASQTSGTFFTSWNVAVTRVEKSKRADWAIGGYRLAGRFYDQVDSFFEREQIGGFFAVSYPFSVFNRIEASTNLRKEHREYDFRGVTVDGVVASNSLSYIKDNAIWGITGPVDGERFRVTLGHTLDIQNNDVNFYTLQVDYRKYFRISPRVTYATRLLGQFNQGKEAYRYFMGGSWDLRLWPRWRIWGRKLFLVNNELRFPFLDRFLLGFPFGGLGFNRIKGAVFVDVGQAWDRDYQFHNVLGSFGIGWRMNIGGFLVLRYEIGKRFTARDLSSPKFTVDSGLRQAFWFGFDF